MQKEKDEKTVFSEYISDKNLKRSVQRENVLDVFLSIEQHLTLEELSREVKQKYPNIGFATVYRTMKLLAECGLCRELRFEDGLTRYEHIYGHGHHDHLVCKKCGKCIEICDPQIEILQEQIFAKNAFVAKGHRLELYGICPDCQPK